MHNFLILMKFQEIFVNLCVDQDWEHEFLIPEVWGEDGKRCPT